jgi:hypothetical protein
VITRAVPPERVRQVLAETGKANERERDLPAQVMVYYVIALALYMGSSTREVLRCLLEGLRWGTVNPTGLRTKFGNFRPDSGTHGVLIVLILSDFSKENCVRQGVGR